MDKELCFCGNRQPYSDCHAEIADNTAMSYLFETFRLIDNDVKQAVPTPKCKKNCSECCKYSFDISAAEYFAVLRYIQKNFTGLQTAMVKSKAVKQLSHIPQFNDTFSNTGRKFYPCIFLDNRNGCRIYEARPLICRMYGYYSDFGNCSNARNKIEFIPDEIDTRVTQFLGDVVTDEFIKPPIVYWFGSEVLKNNDAKKLYMLSHEKDIKKYVQFAVNADFDDWFAV